MIADKRNARRGATLMLVVVIAACGATPDPGTSTPATMPTSSPSPAADQPTHEPTPTEAATLGTTGAPTSPSEATPNPTDEPSPADLSPRPLVWFAPLPPMPGRTGSIDFMDQFTPDAPWSTAAGYMHVYKLYGEWVAYHATDAQLRQAVEDIHRRGLVLAVEAGPLDPPPDCGEGVESFAGIDEGRLIAQRISDAGGRIGVIALDEPYYYGQIYSGPNACQWDTERIANAVAGFVRQMRTSFPELLVGDIEPTPSPVSAIGLADWLEAYESASGEPFAFLHLDMDWARPGWPEMAHEIGERARARDVPVGVIYNGGAAPSRPAWITLAGERVLAFERAGAPPDHVVFQSWMLQPDRVLPDDDESAFSGLVRRYFEDHAGLGIPTSGPGANLALRRPAKASASLGDSPPGAAVDGDFDTTWNAGAEPTQWIEITLDGQQDVAAVRLTIGQFPEGPTVHRVFGRRPTGKLELLQRFEQFTRDGIVLEIRPPSAWTGFSAIRVETRSSPSWVSWREIEVLAP